MIAIIDYGMGNIHSVNKALQIAGAKTIVTNHAKEIASCDKAVLPGVGAFADAMRELKKQKLIPVIKELVKNKTPLLGICLGMQLFFAASDEAEKTKGLGLLKGKVKRFPERQNFKVPHMGWNQIKVTGACPLFKDIISPAYVYFCHSYYPESKDKSLAAASADYGTKFTAAVWQNNLYGVQFHPEKSQGIGLKMLKNFVELC
ncbi:MAG: imidazole glycerol phosphate synthase subunit HisH [Candidatus Omnitrophota bacterium]